VLGVLIVLLVVFSPVAGAADFDNDLVEDSVDNCFGTYNPFQEDFNNDAIGDACDEDTDNDKIMDLYDNCPNIANNYQKDFDKDEIGDACDDDDDNDHIVDDSDLCPDTNLYLLSQTFEKESVMGNGCYLGDFNFDGCVDDNDLRYLNTIFYMFYGKGTITESSFWKGDFNSDSKVDESDLNTIKKYFVKHYKSQQCGSK
jgi:hypothetical protein